MKEETQKTQDVEINEDVLFRDMMLSEQVLAGLTKCNFKKPSPIQLRAIPIGRCGLDLIIQSKSGTGKTLVFCTVILERYNPELKTPQSLIVVPTREIALQVESYLNSIGSACTGFSATSVIGGRDISDDRKRINRCKAIVGTPGRILHLIKNNFVCLQNIQTLVLDEADKLMSDDFYCDINILLNALEKNRQIIASSATYANGLDKLIVSFMHNPIAVSTARDTPVLIGVRQFVLPVDTFASQNTNSTPSIQAMWRKVSAVEYILSTTAFKQCILFSNSQFRANSFANYLTQKKWTVELVLGSHDQSTRTETIQKFRQYKSRILVTSDLMARGVDIVNINLVINLDIPSDSSTYLHRIGRCGRFGRRGLAISLVDGDAEMAKFQKLLQIIGSSKLNVETFPICLNGSTNFDAWSSVNCSDSSNGVFGSVEDVTTNQKDHNNKQSQNKTQNIDLSDVAQLMIGGDSNKNHSAVELDIDLFSSYDNKIDTEEYNDAKTAYSVEVPSMNGPDPFGSCVSAENIDPAHKNFEQNTKDKGGDTQTMAAVERNNLNLLEVAKLLIDSDSNKNACVIDFDTDLFSNYENRSDANASDTKPMATISTGIFENFDQFKSSEGDGHQQTESNDLLSQEPEGDDNEPNPEENDQNRKSRRQKNDDGHIERVSTNYAQHIRNDENFDLFEVKIPKKHEHKMRHYQQSGQQNVEWSAANQLWTAMYQRQLKNINQYVTIAHHRIK